jgi:signal transduction histidine kinase
MVSSKYNALRWIFFAIALSALLGITYMNIQYVDKVRDANKESVVDKKREQVREFASQVRAKFITVPRAIWNIDVDVIKNSIQKTGVPPKEISTLMAQVLEDSVYSSVYFTPSGSNPCESEQSPMYLFDRGKVEFVRTKEFPDLICDGLNLVKTRLKVLLDDYRWNTKTTFDTHRSMNIAIMYPQDRSVIGYLMIVINTDYVLNTFLKNDMERFFGSRTEENDVTVWINDWVKEKRLLSNNPDVEFDLKKIQITERFPGFLDNWDILALVHTPQSQAFAEYETTKNMIILGLSVTLLLVSLVFIVYSAQKEQEITKRQSEFLSNVTHEFKTPLAVIQAAGENLKDGRVKNEERLITYGRHIYDEALRLKLMIEKLLDMARSDANLTKSNPEKCNPDVLIDQILQREYPLLQSKGFEIVVESEFDDCLISVDRGQFETILSNLIENSVKYSRDTYFLSVSTSKKLNKVVIRISDKGIGIQKHAIPHIFEKFYRVEDSLTAHTKGHGLGLSIVKYLVELNGGSISVESVYNKGTQFNMEFPLVEQSLISQNVKHKEPKSHKYAEHITEPTLQK